MDLLTKRLFLREINRDDLAFLYGLERDPLVLKHNLDHIPSAEELDEKYDKILKWSSEAPVRNYCFMVIKADNDSTIGKVTIKLNWDDINEWEIGWYFDPASWGSGYASEAARRVIDFAMNDLHAHRVVSFCNAENMQSEKVMVRIGMKKEGRLRKVVFLDNSWKDQFVYSFLQEDI